MRIAIGGDHAGYPLKLYLVSALKGWGHDVDDQGTYPIVTELLSAPRVKVVRAWSCCCTWTTLTTGASARGT